jgi:hypothetical protein
LLASGRYRGSAFCLPRHLPLKPLNASIGFTKLYIALTESLRPPRANWRISVGMQNRLGGINCRPNN